MDRGLSIALDGGESLLCAIAIVRPVPTVVTGDKRAIEGLEQLIRVVKPLEALSGKIVCLEQTIAALLGRLGEASIRAAICAEPGADVALSLSFQCGRGIGGIRDADGLRSYIQDLQCRAPTVLAQAAPF